MVYNPSLFQLIRFPSFMRRQWWTQEQIQKHQEIRLKSLLHHAYENVPFYAGCWREHGVHPDVFQRLEDLSQFPLIDSLSLRQSKTEDITSRIHDLSTCHSCLTSGSSGIPFRVYMQTDDHFRLVKAAVARAMLANGLRITDRLVRFDPSPAAARTRFQGRCGIWPRLVLSGQGTVEQWVDAITRFSPTVMAGMSVCMVDIAEELERRGLHLPLRKIFCSGMRLEEHHRRRLQQFYGAVVYDMYGAYESGLCAWECGTCGEYHINSDLAVFEILKPDGSAAAPGEEGEVVVTNLYSDVLPFIRYRQGDLAVVSRNEPKCGRNVPLVSEFRGRHNDRIMRKDGTSISYYAISTPIIHTPGVKEWRFEQDRSGSCTLRVVVDSLFEQHRTQLEATLREILCESPLQIRIESRLERSPQTKWKSIVSLAANSGSD